MARETWVETWSQPEPELHFSEELQKTNAHARRGPYRLLPKDRSLEVDAAAVNAVLRVYPEAIEIGSVRGAFAGNASEVGSWSIILIAVIAFFLPYSLYAATRGIWLYAIGGIGFVFIVSCLLVSIFRGKGG